MQYDVRTSWLTDYEFHSGPNYLRHPQTVRKLLARSWSGLPPPKHARPVVLITPRPFMDAAEFLNADGETGCCCDPLCFAGKASRTSRLEPRF